MNYTRNWSDNDHHRGPFTWGFDKGKNWTLLLDSGKKIGRCTFRVVTPWFYLLVAMPQLIKPGRPAGDYEDHGREYGISLSSDNGMISSPWFLQCRFGLQTWSSATSQKWNCFLPWTDWRHVRRSLYDKHGRHFYTEIEKYRKFGHQWAAMDAVVRACPQVVFEFDDYDGKRIKALARVEEREWHFGTKFFKWLSFFRKPMIRRSLELDFSEEVGPEKGSWKGGIMGHGIEMLPGETHESAFRRYCEQEHSSKYGMFRIKFIGPVSSKKAMSHLSEPPAPE